MNSKFEQSLKIFGILFCVACLSQIIVLFHRFSKSKIHYKSKLELQSSGGSLHLCLTGGSGLLLTSSTRKGSKFERERERESSCAL